jgi:hypothetical protein
MRLIQEADVDAVLCEKMIKLDLPTTKAVGVPECEPQGFYRAPPRPCCHILPQRITVFRTARDGAGPEGRSGMAVRSRQVSSTQVFMGRVSRRYENSSTGDWLIG